MSYLDILRAQLPIDEGEVDHAYQDSEGYWTIGIGHLIDPRVGGKVSKAVIDLMFGEDMATAEIEARRLFHNFGTLSEHRKAALCNLSFNLGFLRLSKFVRFIDAVNAERWDDAGKELRDSKWYTQVKTRGERIAMQIETEDT